MLKIINPTTEALLREIAVDGPEVIGAKYQRAKAAQPGWNSKPLPERLAILDQFKQLLTTHQERLAQTLTSEMGKPISQARNEINGVKARIDFFLENTERVLKTETVWNDQGMREEIQQEPLGVVANISAWNYPYFVGANVFIPALLTGNSVLYKPSEHATLTGLAIAELLWEAGVPKDVFIPVIGTGLVGAELLKQPINGVFFTGSVGTGQKINGAAAQSLVRVQLELGGKDPAYACEDIDVANAAAGIADGAFYNTGQSCCSVERIYVHQNIYQGFVEAFVATVKGFVTGDPLDEKTYIGPLARAAQLDFLDRQVKDAVQKGAKLLCGGARIKGKGFYYQPTVFSDVNHTMELMREESFGPLIGIQKVKDDAEALRLMNETQYGLTAAVYTRDENRARHLLQAVHSGSVYWNCCDRVSPRLPWSGRGHSGIGSTLSTLGIQAFVQPKAWHLRKPQ